MSDSNTSTTYEPRHRPTPERVGTPRAWALAITATLRESSGVGRNYVPRHSADFPREVAS